MPKPLLSLIFFYSLLHLRIVVADHDYPRCSCNDEGFWRFDNLLDFQRVSDFFIAVAYFSIPIELIYFVSCSSFPFKWVLFQFIAFIVLCGMTHLLNSWTYRPHSFHLMLAVTIFKLLTALVSFATAITLISLIPMLLKVKVREFMLMKKAWDLDREVGMIRKQTEAGRHVRMLTYEIRKSLDRHTILYTTLVELSKTLSLQNCAVWMPDPGRTEMSLTHELAGRRSSSDPQPIPTSEPVVRKIKTNDGVHVIDPESPIAVASSLGSSSSSEPPGSVAAIRMPMLRVADFKGGTPEMVPACYAILVLVLPEEEGRSWTRQELEIVEVVADQVAVALSHVAVLEESQLMQEKLEERNRALQRAREDALRANQARNLFQTEMSKGMRRPLHSILGLCSSLQDDDEEVSLSYEQRLIVDSMVQTSGVLVTLTSDIMDTLAKDNGRLQLDIRTFSLQSMIREAACTSKGLCYYKGCDFLFDVDGPGLPDRVLGDERRVFQAILHMVGNTLNATKDGGGCLMLRIYPTSGSRGLKEKRRGGGGGQFRATSYHGLAFVRFDLTIRFLTGSKIDKARRPLTPYGGQRFRDVMGESMSFKTCRKLVQAMQGDMWVTQAPEGFDQCTALLLGFQIEPPSAASISESSDSVNLSKTLCRGLKVLLADSDEASGAVTRKLLEKLGCAVTTVTSGFDCLTAVGPSNASAYEMVVLDLRLPDLDGFGVCARIRKFRSCHSRPLIVALIAGEDDDEDVREKCGRVGMNGSIQKPGSLRGVATELRRVLLHANGVLF